MVTKNGWTLIGYGRGYSIWENRKKKIFNVAGKNEYLTKGMGGYRLLSTILDIKGIATISKRK